MSTRRKEPEVIVFEEPKFKKKKTATRERDICRVSRLFNGGGLSCTCMHGSDADHV